MIRFCFFRTILKQRICYDDLVINILPEKINHTFRSNSFAKKKKTDVNA